MPKFGSRLVLTGLERSCCSPRDQRTVDRTDPIASRTGTESPVLLVLVLSSPSLFPVLRTGPSSTIDSGNGAMWRNGNGMMGQQGNGMMGQQGNGMMGQQGNG
jgi:hypothetical protein